MLKKLAQIPHRRALFIIFTLIVLGKAGEDIVSEFATGETVLEMADDIALFLLSALIIVLFGVDHFRQQHDLKDLSRQLENTRGQLSLIDAKSQKIASEYREVMQKQLDVWNLTASEQEVVFALLKGLSFREVAELRETREKTVRQQATSVYKKAGVAGRHELAAWFLEDMLGPPTDIENQA